MGRAVAPRSSPVSSPRTEIASRGGSLPGSFDHGGSLFPRLLTDHVYPEPDSETWKPKTGLAITLIQGAGVCRSSLRTVTYSRPSAAKPPRPLKNSSAGRGSARAPDGFVGLGLRAAGRPAI